MQDQPEHSIRVGCLSCPDGMLSDDSFASEVERHVEGARLDILVTSELPFGAWLARSSDFDVDRAHEHALLHERGLAWLQRLRVPLIASSLASMGARLLRNETVLVANGEVRRGHAKRHLPREPDWFEASWFERGTEEPQVLHANGLKLGLLVCTEAMRPEDARAMGASGVDLILVPRATGAAAMWQHALGMLAVSAGAFVCSANRSAAMFAGSADAFGPNGERLHGEDIGSGIRVFEVDVSAARAAKSTYPRDVLLSLPAAAASEAAEQR